ncbi:MAG TPA: transglutaminase-like domain-containing protein [Chryseolinea sp.]|nr:transglutaminase-like domain-containing protein [Chryseolinea sp.]
MKDVPAFKAEPFMTSEDDYVSKINFALAYVNFPGQATREIMGSWDKLRTELLESQSFSKAVSGSNFLKKTVEEIIAGKTEPMQKIETIHTYVKKTLEWNGEKDKYADDLKKVMETKKGTAADINITLASMLEKAGIDVELVLLSTRDHGFIRQSYPMEEQLNYVVCLVRLDGKPIFLDATEKYIPVGVLPERCLNGEGLIISKINTGWISLDSKTKSRTVYSADMTLNSEGELKGKLNISRDGYDALEMREDYHAIGEKEYLKDYLGAKANWMVEKSEFQNMKEIDKVAKEIHELQINEHASLAGDAIYLNPFVTGQLEKNPFTLETREYPVNYGSPQEVIYSCRIALPDSFAIDEMPQSKVFMLPGNAAKYMYNVSQMGNTISITSSFQISKTLFVQNDYPHLREFYNLVVAKEAEQIVLKKK